MDVQACTCSRENPGLLDREEVLQRAGRYRVLRRIRDIVLSVLALVVIWPGMLAIAALIVIDSPGAGPIFQQTRVGRNGKPFQLYKFRSMCPDAEEKLEELMKYNETDGPVFKMINDPRITRIGRLLRRSGFDELPQLINIIKGDMSLVGPRPGLPREVEQYDDYTRQRLLVLPGLTCYWQIKPCRNRVSFREWVELDLQYIRDCSLLTDWKILAATVGAVIGMNGA